MQNENNKLIFELKFCNYMGNESVEEEWMNEWMYEWYFCVAKREVELCIFVC